MTNFKCEHCGEVVEMQAVGTKHRNHCPKCLWSKHLDELQPGDREAKCEGMMEPIVLTFKNDGGRKGELMLVHQCVACGVVEKNRIAGDDEEEVVLALFTESLKRTRELKKIAESGIQLAGKADEREIVTQLYGKPEAQRRFS